MSRLGSLAPVGGLSSAFVLALILAARPVAAQEQVIFAPPEGFVQAYDAANADGGIVEFVPAGETVENWRRMATVTWATGLAGQPPQVMADGISAGMAQSCPTGRAEVVHETEQNGYAVAIVALDCPGPAPDGSTAEQAIIKVVGGQDATYTFQYAWKGVAAVDTQRGYMEWTVPQILCNTAPRPGEAAHPCP